jgi:hypothetical protein
LPKLPTQPPNAILPYPDYVDLLAKLGRKLSVELVFGDELKDGLSLLDGIQVGDGRRLDREAVEQARQRSSADAHHEDQNRILSILADAAREPGVLGDIVFWEIAEVLRPLARLGYSQRAIVEQAVRLSIERGQAEVLAAAVAEEWQVLKSPRPAAQPKIKRDNTADGSSRQDLRTELDLLKPIADLRIRPMRGRTDVVQLSWSLPPAGVAALRMAGMPPPWPPGTIIARGDINGYGWPVDANGVLGPDRRMSCELTLPQARTFVTAITVGDTDAAVGRTVEITREAPVRGLSARRFGDEVRLTWIWPDEAAAAYVAWQPSATLEDQHGPPAGRQQRSCSRRGYEAEGGFAAVMGHLAQRVEVWAVIRANGEEHVTVPAEIEVPAMGTPVYYDLRPSPGFRNGFLRLIGRRRQRELRLSAELSCVLPDLIVVERRHSAIPLTPHDGVVVARIPGGLIGPNTPVRTTIKLGAHGPSWIACFIDPAGPPGARSRVTLLGPPEARQRVK